MELDRIRLALEVDSNAWAAGLRGAATQLGTFGTQVDGLLGKITGKLTTASGLFTAFGAAIGLAFGASIGPAIQFEQAFTGVLKTVDGSKQQLTAVRDGILDMSRTMPVAAGEIAGVAEAAGQLGVGTDDILEFSETMIQLGVTTNMTADQAATSMARFANIMGTPLTEVDKLGAGIAYLGNNFATTESEIVQWGLRLAGAGAVAGATEADVLAIGAAMSSLGISAEMGATAISRVWMDMTTAVETASPKLEVFAETAGMTSDAFATMFQDNPAEALNQFVTGLARVEAEGGSAVLVLDALGLDGARLAQVLLSASSAGDILSTALQSTNQAMSEGTALTDEYGKFAETTAARIEILKNKFTALAIEVGTPALAGVVVVLEGIGDAVEFLGDTFGPLGSEIGETFVNLATAAELFFTTLGSPALQVAGAALVGLSTVLTGLLDAFNALGPAGVVMAVIAADILLVGPASMAAAAGLTTMAAGGGAAAAGMGMLNAAISAGPLIVAVGMLAAVGKSLLDAKASAEEAATAFEDRLNKALDSGSLQEYNAALTDTAERMAELAEIDKVDEGLGGGLESWGTALKSVGQILTPFTENTVVNARAELEALNEQAEKSGVSFERVSPALGLMAANLGLTTEETYKLAQEAGVLDVVLGKQISGFSAAQEAVGALAAEHEGARQSFSGSAAEFEAFSDAMDAGAGTIPMVADSLGTTTEALGFFAEKAGVVDDLLDKDSWGPARLSVQATKEAYEGIAAQIGLTADQLAEQVVSLTTAAQAYADLASSVDGYRQSLAALESANVALDNANVALAEAKAGFDGTEASARTYAASIREVVLANAAAGTGVQETISLQAGLSASFVETARAAGLPLSVIAELTASYLSVPDSVITDIDADADNAIAAAEEINSLLDEMAAKAIVLQIEAETGVAQGQIEAIFAVTEDWDQTVAIAEFEADTGASGLAVAELLAIGADWDSATYTAQMMADGASAESILLSLAQQGASWDTLVATATFLADGDMTKTQEFLSLLEDVDGYEALAKLIAEAEGEADIQRIIDLMNGVQDKTVTISVRGQTFSTGGNTYTPTRAASGGFSADGNIYYADGGMTGPIRETAGMAKIYTPTPRNRVHSEPVTGGEAYIPLGHNKRDRSVPIWKETGRRLGMFADGGIADTMAYAGGGIASGSFMDPVGIPVRVDVDVNGRGIGALEASLAGVAGSLRGLGEAAQFGANGITSSIEKSTASAQGFTQEVAVWPEHMRRSFGTMEEYAARTGQSLADVQRYAAEAFGTIEIDARTSADKMLAAFEGAGIGIEQVASDAGRAMTEAMDPDVFLATMERITGWLASDLGPVLEGFGNDVSQTIEWIEDAGLSMEDVFRTVFVEAASDVDILISAMGLLESAMNDTETASRRLDDSMNFLHGQTLGLIEAQNDATLATARFAEEIEKGATSGDRMSEAGAKTSDSLIRLGDTYRDLIIAVAESGAGMEATQSVYDAQVGKFRELAAAAGLSTEDINALVDALFQMPAELVTQIAVEGLEQKELVDDFIEVMEELGGFIANPTVDVDGEEANRKLGDIIQQLTDLELKGDTLVTVNAETGDVELDLENIHQALADITEQKATASVDADTSDADLALELLGVLLTSFTSDEWKAQLGADDQASPVIETPTQLATTFASTPYDASIDATDNASATISAPKELAITYAAGQYNAKLEATDAGASGQIQGLKGSADTYAAGPYNAQLLATDAGASGAIAGVKGLADAYATTYTATLNAIDNASGVINGVAGAARAAAGTYTVAINTVRTETVRQVTQAISSVGSGAAAGASGGGASGGGPSLRRALGGMSIAGGFRAMAEGDILHRQAMMMPGRSNILWAEDIDGESYIPHAPWKRDRSAKLLAETANLFGYGLHRMQPAAGRGGGTSVVVGPGAVVIDITAPQGTDGREFARIAEQAVDRGLARFGRELSLSLPGRR